MPQRLTALRARAAGRAGFTLVEVLITLTVLGIVGGLVTGVLTRQQRFYRDAAETVEVRRELRGSASLIPADLRAISTAANNPLDVDLRVAAANNFEIRAAIGSAVVCARPSATELDLVPLGLANHTLAAWYTTPGAGDRVFVFNEGPGTGDLDDTWWADNITAFSQSTSLCPGSPFIDATLDATKPRTRLRFTNAVPADVQVGAVVRITRRMRYMYYQPAGATGGYLGYQELRNGAWSSLQPIAGPLRTGDGVRFAYYDTLDVAQPVPVTDLTRISRIDVTLRGIGRSDALGLRNGEPYQDSLFFRVGIRNFR